MNLDIDRFIEAAAIMITALAAAFARMCMAIQMKQDWPPDDVDGARLWWRRFGWSVAGEVAACTTFVMVAEAIVIVRGYSGPIGVILGAAAATLGFPFVAGILRSRVEKKLGEGEN